MTRALPTTIALEMFSGALCSVFFIRLLYYLPASVALISILNASDQMLFFRSLWIFPQRLHWYRCPVHSELCLAFGFDGHFPQRWQ
jgi:hypothetical protein